MEFTLWKKDLDKSLFRVSHKGLCVFFKFIEHANSKELKQFRKIKIYPRNDGHFFIDFEPRNVKKVFRLNGESVDNFIAFYESCEKGNIARMNMRTEK